MAIVNRDNDATQQKEAVHQAYKNVGVGSTVLAGGSSYWIGGPMPYPYLLESARTYVLGISGAPALRLIIDRFVAGQTRIVCSISNMVLTNYGTSGSFGVSGLAPLGSTLLQGQAGDQLSFDVVGANTAITDITISVVVRKSQDIVSHHGVST